MKNKILLTCIVIAALIVLLLSQTLLLEAKPNPRSGEGKFDDADFFTPDYNNGGTETFGTGGERTFNYKCYCANQPGQKPCNGNIILQVDTGSGFVNEKSSPCNVDEGQWCSVNHTKTFNTPDTYTFRIFCDESAGTDYTQPSNEHVVLTVQESGCTENETQNCPLQQGVCEGAFQTCINGSWTECDYGSNYETEETSCDELDNDCNGLVDDVDADADGSSPCGGMGTVNELLITGLNGDSGNITIFTYEPSTSSYDAVWSTDTAGVTSVAGVVVGDVTNDDLNDFLISRFDGSNWYVEVWTFNSSGEWYNVWTGAQGDINVNLATFIGGVGDFDNDTFNEFVINNEGPSAIEVWGNDVSEASSFSKEATIKFSCGTYSAIGSGDLNGNGVPEIVFQCAAQGLLRVWEWNGTGYEEMAVVTAPLAFTDAVVMWVDDMDCSMDLNRDTKVDCVFCGNSAKSHVLSYTGSGYEVVYNTSKTSGNAMTQACSAVDATNDGFGDWFDYTEAGWRVFSYTGSEYVNVWNSGGTGWLSVHIASGAGGDSDNDGRGEFLAGNRSMIHLWENDTSVDAKSFENTFTWASDDSNDQGPAMIIGNLNPFNDDAGVDCNDSASSVYPGALDICGDGVDQDCSGSDTTCNCVDSDNDTYNAYNAVYCPSGNDCNDNNASINPGVNEICGNGIDDDCDDEIDEGCGPVCGDDYCDGSAYNEDCRTCPEDCWAGERGACCGDNKCDTRKGETALICPVDCS